jgi:DNA invertase Pin-like site-specific DNA recombinase
MSSFMPPPSALRPGATIWDYLRDSGGSSQELSILQQAQEVENFCSQYGLVHVRTNRDVARSGTSTAGRDAFLEMIDLLRDPQVRPHAILIWNFARFARDVTDALYYKSLIRKYGIIIHSLTDPVPDSEYGFIIETLIDFSNQEKSRQTSRDVKRSLHNMVGQGYSSGGTPPRCYIAEKVQTGERRDGTPRIVTRWVPDPELWDLGQLAWKMRAQGKSYGDIQEATGGRLYQSVGSWNSFFANESYLGIGKCGEEKVENHHPALVDQETWDAVNKLRKYHTRNGAGNSANHPRRQHRPSLLTGLLFCIQCGSAMEIQNHQNGWRCYICGKKSRRGWATCPERMVNARNVEIIAINTLLNRILTPESFNALLDAVQERVSDRASNEKKIKALHASISKIDRAILNLLKLIEGQGSESAAARLKEREKEKTLLKAQLLTLQAEMASLTLKVSPETLETVFQDWRHQVVTSLQKEDILAVRLIIKAFITRIDAGYDHVRIFYRYPIREFPGFSDSTSHQSLDGACLEEQQSTLTPDILASIFEIAPYLAPAPLYQPLPVPVNPRDVAIYRLHTEEKRTIPSLAKEFGLSEKRIWGICTKMRKTVGC